MIETAAVCFCDKDKSDGNVIWQGIVLWVANNSNFWGRARSPGIKIASVQFLYLEVFTTQKLHLKQ